MRLYDLIQPLYEKSNSDASYRKIYEYSTKGTDYYITFSTLDKVGINPSSDWTTPNGVYVYPLWKFERELKYHLNDDAPLNKKLKQVFPYGADRKYAFILKYVGDKQLNVVTDERSIGDDVLYNTIKGIIKNYDIDAYDKANALKYAQEEIYGNNRKGSFGSFLYKLILNTLTELDGLGKKRTNIFNKILRELGYDSLLDPGSGIMHENEPTQAVFLTPSSFVVVEKIHIFPHRDTDDVDMDSVIWEYIKNKKTIPESVIVNACIKSLGTFSDLLSAGYKFKDSTIIKIMNSNKQYTDGILGLIMDEMIPSNEVLIAAINNKCLSVLKQLMFTKPTLVTGEVLSAANKALDEYIKRYADAFVPYQLSRQLGFNASDEVFGTANNVMLKKLKNDWSFLRDIKEQNIEITDEMMATAEDSMISSLKKSGKYFKSTYKEMQSFGEPTKKVKDVYDELEREYTR